MAEQKLLRRVKVNLFENFFGSGSGEKIKSKKKTEWPFSFKRYDSVRVQINTAKSGRYSPRGYLLRALFVSAPFIFKCVTQEVRYPKYNKRNSAYFALISTISHVIIEKFMFN